LTVAFVGGAIFSDSGLLKAESATVYLNQTAADAGSVDLSSFWRVWKLINDRYVSSTATSSVALTDEEKVWGAIGGLVDSLEDPYSSFMPPEENKMFNEEISGNFGGVGMEIGVRDKVLTVISPLPNTPAKKAGILSGDKILEIDGRSTMDMSSTEAIKFIRGPAGTTVSLTLLRGEEAKTRVFKVVRANIEIPTIESVNLPGKITQIKLFNFSANAAELFKKALKDFAQSGNTGLILDLRGNPGGYLDAAIDVASWFLPEGTPVVTERRGESDTERIYRSYGYKAFTKNPKMVVLVDEGSASASEIVAGALREHGIAKLVGEQTFGKGSVQELFSISKNTSLKLTVARWFTPKGVSISQNGLKPDIEVKIGGVATSTDPQLDRAVRLIREGK
jgi:carboxyl-terminal processing protease